MSFFHQHFCEMSNSSNALFSFVIITTLDYGAFVLRGAKKIGLSALEYIYSPNAPRMFATTANQPSPTNQAR